MSPWPKRRPSRPNRFRRPRLLKNCALGVSATATNSLKFNDGYALAGNWRLNFVATCRQRLFARHWTKFQLNVLNLGDQPGQVTRFAPDHGREVIVSIAQEF